MSAPRFVRDIRPGSNGSTPSWLTAVGSTLYFTADDGVNGFQLWRSDGTAGGTQLVASSRQFSSGPTNLTALGSTLFFTASDGISGAELWKSNGTAAGTVLVTDIEAGSRGSLPSFSRRLTISSISPPRRIADEGSGERMELLQARSFCWIQVLSVPTQAILLFLQLGILFMFHRMMGVVKSGRRMVLPREQGELLPLIVRPCN
ncbi:MAG: ELWxxDGT repeat protein [Cyanobium sp.]|nr:ELWxxDGT repeat protein [Cyanobium sp.]